MKNYFQNLTGAPMRVFFLIVTDLFWSNLVLIMTLWCYRTFRYIDYRLVPFRDFGFIAVGIVVINSLAKGYHGSLWNPGAVINRIEEIRRLTLSTIGAYSLGILLLYVNGRDNEYPLLAIVCSCVVTAFGFPFARFMIRYLMKKLCIGQIRVIIAGAGKTACSIGEELDVSTYYGFEIVGYLDDDPSKKNFTCRGKKWIGRIADAKRLGEKYGVHYVITCLPPIVLPQVIKELTKSFKHVLVIPASNVMPITAIYPTLIGFTSCFELQNRVLFILPRLLKSGLEILAAGVAVIFLLPLFCILSIVVKISSPGPIFYSAKRLGKNGKTIYVLKFRSMYQDAENRLKSMLAENPDLAAEWKKNFKLENDPRVTPIGDFLRKTSLDELPQFINVLRGEMSIIGPRPIVTDEIPYYGEHYDYFKRVKPGITGLWQVSGRSDVDYDQRVALDMFYVMNWSLWLDMYIFIKTFFVVLSRRGAH